MLFIAKGNATFGQKQTNEAGEIIKQTPATFSTDENGSCVAVGELDEDATELTFNIHSIHGDWDAAGYLGAILEALKPRRQVNLPDFKAIFKAALEDGSDLCDYCLKNPFDCRDCIVNQWKVEEQRWLNTAITVEIKREAEAHSISSTKTDTKSVSLV